MLAFFVKPSKFRVIHLGRHGRSRIDLAQDSAKEDGKTRFQISGPDWQQPLTSLGRRQSMAQGVFLAKLDKDHIPTLFVGSSFVRTEQALDQLFCGGRFTPDQTCRIIHRGFRHRALGDRHGYTTAKAFFRENEGEQRRRDDLGRLDYAYPRGESHQAQIERVSRALGEIEDSYAARHSAVFIQGHKGTVIACVAVYCGLGTFDTWADSEVRNGSITTLVRDETTGCMKIVRTRELPGEMSKAEYGRCHRQQKNIDNGQR